MGRKVRSDVIHLRHILIIVYAYQDMAPRRFCFFLLNFWVFFMPDMACGQSQVFVINSGLSIGSQRWNDNFDRNLLFQYHGAVAIETLNNEDDRSAVFAQLGYHVKGSSTRFQFFTLDGGRFQTVDRFKFNNISLLLGAKMKKPLGAGDSKYFYFGGVRGDYTYSTNIDELGGDPLVNPFIRIYYPSIGFMRRFMFGVSAGMGVQLPISELVGAEFKIGVHPDFTPQYNQPPLVNVIDPLNPGQNLTLPERQIRNTTVELSVALRLTRKVILID
jgi:hypothetical protein